MAIIVTINIGIDIHIHSEKISLAKEKKPSL